MITSSKFFQKQFFPLEEQYQSTFNNQICPWVSTSNRSLLKNKCIREFRSRIRKNQSQTQQIQRCMRYNQLPDKYRSKSSINKQLQHIKTQFTEQNLDLSCLQSVLLGNQKRGVKQQKFLLKNKVSIQFRQNRKKSVRSKPKILLPDIQNNQSRPQFRPLKINTSTHNVTKNNQFKVLLKNRRRMLEQLNKSRRKTLIQQISERSVNQNKDRQLVSNKYGGYVFPIPRFSIHGQPTTRLKVLLTQI